MSIAIGLLPVSLSLSRNKCVAMPHLRPAGHLGERRELIDLRFSWFYQVHGEQHLYFVALRRFGTCHEPPPFTLSVLCHRKLRQCGLPIEIPQAAETDQATQVGEQLPVSRSNSQDAYDCAYAPQS